MKDHPQYDRLNKTYGHLTKEQVDEKIDRMSAEIKDLQHVGRREFTGNGTRRSGPAMANQGARELGEEKLLLGAYRDEKFGEQSASDSESTSPAANPEHHQVSYNGKVVSMDYVSDPKDQFKRAGQRIADNIGSGQKGHILTPKGQVYEISAGSKKARLLSGDEAEAAKSHFPGALGVVSGDSQQAAQDAANKKASLLDLAKKVAESPARIV